MLWNCNNCASTHNHVHDDSMYVAFTTTIPNVFELGAHSLYISCRLLLYICTIDPLSVMSWRTCDVMNPVTTVYTGDNLGRSSGIPYIGRTRSRVTRFHVAGRLVGSKEPYLLGDS